MALQHNAIIRSLYSTWFPVRRSGPPAATPAGTLGLTDCLAERRMDERLYQPQTLRRVFLIRFCDSRST
jgi:hypothetical protein